MTRTAITHTAGEQQWLKQARTFLNDLDAVAFSLLKQQRATAGDYTQLDRAIATALGDSPDLIERFATLGCTWRRLPNIGPRLALCWQDAFVMVHNKEYKALNTAKGHLREINVATENDADSDLLKTGSHSVLYPRSAKLLKLKTEKGSYQRSLVALMQQWALEKQLDHSLDGRGFEQNWRCKTTQEQASFLRLLLDLGIDDHSLPGLSDDLDKLSPFKNHVLSLVSNMHDYYNQQLQGLGDELSTGDKNQLRRQHLKKTKACMQHVIDTLGGDHYGFSAEEYQVLRANKSLHQMYERFITDFFEHTLQHFYKCSMIAAFNEKLGAEHKLDTIAADSDDWHQRLVAARSLHEFCKAVVTLESARYDDRSNKSLLKFIKPMAKAAQDAANAAETVDELNAISTTLHAAARVIRSPSQRNNSTLIAALTGLPKKPAKRSCWARLAGAGLMLVGAAMITGSVVLAIASAGTLTPASVAIAKIGACGVIGAGLGLYSGVKGTQLAFGKARSPMDKLDEKTRKLFKKSVTCAVNGEDPLTEPLLSGALDDEEYKHNAGGGGPRHSHNGVDWLDSPRGGYSPTMIGGGAGVGHLGSSHGDTLFSRPPARRSSFAADAYAAAERSVLDAYDEPYFAPPSTVVGTGYGDETLDDDELASVTGTPRSSSPLSSNHLDHVPSDAELLELKARGFISVDYPFRDGSGRAARMCEEKIDTMLRARGLRAPDSTAVDLLTAPTSPRR